MPFPRGNENSAGMRIQATLAKLHAVLLLAVRSLSSTESIPNANATACQICVSECGAAKKESPKPLWFKALQVGDIGLEPTTPTMST